MDVSNDLTLLGTLYQVPALLECFEFTEYIDIVDKMLSLRSHLVAVYMVILKVSPKPLKRRPPTATDGTQPHDFDQNRPRILRTTLQRSSRLLPESFVKPLRVLRMAAICTPLPITAARL